jgi:hypothetical protein
MKASEMRVIINGATLLALLIIAQREAGGEIPDVVTFAAWLSEAEDAAPVEDEWYNTCLPHLLLAVGDVVKGEDPEMTRIAFFAAATHE